MIKAHLYVLHFFNLERNWRAWFYKSKKSVKVDDYNWSRCKTCFFQLTLQKIKAMNTSAIKKELSTYIPLLSVKQQTLVLDVIKNILNVDATEKRISISQYNKEIDIALKEVRAGKGISHDEVLNQNKKWIAKKQR